MVLSCHFFKCPDCIFNLFHRVALNVMHYTFLIQVFGSDLLRMIAKMIN